MIQRRACLKWGAWGASSMAAAIPAWSQPTPATPGIGDRVSWPAIRLLDGRAVSQPMPGGPASIIVFFSTTCPFCVRHNDRLQKLLSRTHGAPLRILGVAEDRQPAHVRTYLQRRGLSFDVSMDHGPMRAALSSLKGVPVTCAVDRQQRLREVIRGEMAEDDVLGLAKWSESA